MFVVVHGSKGGVGTSTVAAALAVLAARRSPSVLVDPSGDGAAALGRIPGDQGWSDWVEASDPPPDSLSLLEVGDAPSVLGPGSADPGTARVSERAAVAAELWAGTDRLVVVDAGGLPARAVAALLGRADRSVLVVRNCYLALRSVPAIEGDVVVAVCEPGRALRRRDVVDAVAPRPCVVVPHDAAVARAVDAGLLARAAGRRLQDLEEVLWSTSSNR